MLFLARMLLAWILAVVSLTIIGTVISSGPWSKNQPFEGLIGIGLIIGIPMLAFSIIIALPLSYYLASIRMNWLETVAATASFGGIAAVLALMVFSADWRGAAGAFIIFAVLLGLFWGLLGYIFARSPAGF
jgi:hypothetical protein